MWPWLHRARDRLPFGVVVDAHAVEPRFESRQRMQSGVGIRRRLEQFDLSEHFKLLSMLLEVDQFLCRVRC